MSSLSRNRNTAWDERLARINAGRTITQTAEAEGTIPTHYGKRPSRGPAGIRGVIAWATSGTLAWLIGTAMSVADPGAQIASKPELASAAPLISAYGNPLIAFSAFMLALSMLRVIGLLPRLLGIAIMAWVFALQAELGVPSLSELMELGRGVIAGEVDIASSLMALQDWAKVVFA